MFGYVNINKPELKVKEYYKYKAYYCGLCHQLKQRYGRLGQMTLTYDMTFLIIVLTSLYESNVTQFRKRCLAHPAQKHDMIVNEISDYAADMNIALTYHKFLDDWMDDKNVLSYSGAGLLKHRYQKVEQQYPRQCETIKRCLNELKELELSDCQQLDLITKPFGELMGELFVYREDQWKDTMRKMGVHLGRFIYLMDAYEDLPKDIKSNSYNPLKQISQKPEYEKMMQDILTMMMSECTTEFEKLPLLWDVELLRNILYAGVWKHYDEIQKKRQNQSEGKDTKL